jgi:hypothetical protein
MTRVANAVAMILMQRDFAMHNMDRTLRMPTPIPLPAPAGTGLETARSPRLLTMLPTCWNSILSQGEPLPKLSGIGVDLAGKINEIVTTGHCALH